MDFPFAPFDDALARSGVDCGGAAAPPLAGLGGGEVYPAAEDRAPGDGGAFELPLLPLKKPLEDLPGFLPPPLDEDLPNPLLLPLFCDLSALLPVTSKPSCMTDPGTGRSGPT